MANCPTFAILLYLPRLPAANHPGLEVIPGSFKNVLPRPHHRQETVPKIHGTLENGFST